MKACAKCGKEVDEADMFMSERGEICGECEWTSEVEAIEGLSLVHPAVIVGVISGLVPFFVKISDESTTTTAEGVTTTSYLDYAAVSGGAVAALAGLVFLVMALREKEGIAHYGVSLVMLALGVVHLLRGFGVLSF